MKGPLPHAPMGLFGGLFGYLFLFALAVCLPSLTAAESEVGWAGLPDGDVVRANPVAIQSDDWELELNYTDATVKTVPLRIWRSSQMEAEEEGLHCIRFRNGDVLTGTLTGWGDSKIRFQPFWGGELEVAEKRLERIEFRNEEETVYLNGISPLSDWTYKQFSQPGKTEKNLLKLEIGPSLHLRNHSRFEITRSLPELPSRFRLQARWTGNLKNQRHTLNLSGHHEVRQKQLNMVVNFSDGRARILTSSLSMRNQEEYVIEPETNRQEVELFLDYVTGEWIVSINGVRRAQNFSGLRRDHLSPHTVSRVLRWHSFSDDPIVFEHLRIEAWPGTFPEPDTDIPEEHVGLMLRNGDGLHGKPIQFEGEVFEMEASGMKALPVPLNVVKHIRFEPEVWKSHSIGAGRYLIFLRDYRSLLRLGDLSLSEGVLSGVMPCGERIKIPIDRVLGLQAGLVKEGG